jgi:drug/metabolite transporter (DMT)-like permease
VAFSLSIGMKLKKLELIGTALVIVGCVGMYFDPNAERNDGETIGFWIYLLILLTSIPGALYFLINSRLVKKVPIFTLLLVMNFHNFLFNSLLAKIINPYEVQIFSIDPVYGCYGFLNP